MNNVFTPTRQIWGCEDDFVQGLLTKGRFRNVGLSDSPVRVEVAIKALLQG